MPTATGVLIAALVSSFLSASVMTALQLPGTVLPLVLALAFAAAAWMLRDLARALAEPPLMRCEQALLAFALLIGLLRLAPYAWQYAAGVLVAPVTWDDNWHFQELASLVNAERFPPRLNFQPEAHLHFYYLAWIPAAGLSSLALTLAGAPLIKLGLALGALALDVGIAWALIVTLRHFCGADAGPARLYALAALVVAGAAVDGLFALRNLLAAGYPVHAEWWQLGLLVHNSFSALSSSLIWVPHHMIAGAAMLLAVVVATEPVTLVPRAGRAPWIVAGLLIGTAAFSSIFAFAGAVLALVPLLIELVRDQDRRRLGWLMAACVGPALPLAYIYLGADARGGFVLGQPFMTWWGQSGNVATGLLGVVLALLLMVLEVGWLFVIGRGLDRGSGATARLRTIAVAAALVLASTAFVAFSGSNNWALRATIVPVILLACYCGHGLAVAPSHAPAKPAAMPPARLDPMIVARAGVAALGLAAIAHVNEVALLVGTAWRAPAFSVETAACKTAILAANRKPGPLGPPDLSACTDAHSAYHLERPFTKPVLSVVDRELMGRGFGFLGRGSAGAPTAGEASRAAATR